MHEKEYFRDEACWFAAIKYFTAGLSGLNVRCTKLEQTAQSGCWDSSEVWPPEAQPACAARRDFLNLCWVGGARWAAVDQLCPVCPPLPVPAFANPSCLLIALILWEGALLLGQGSFCIKRSELAISQPTWMDLVSRARKGSCCCPRALPTHLFAGESVTGPRWSSCLSL